MSDQPAKLELRSGDVAEAKRGEGTRASTAFRLRKKVLKANER